MISRREWLGLSLGAGAGLALTPQLVRALAVAAAQASPPGKLIQRAIPSTGEMIPVIGGGFANHTTCADPAVLKEVLKTFFEHGGRVFDTNHGNSPASQQLHSTLARELGIQDQLFWSVRSAVSGGRSAEEMKAHVESLFATFNAARLDMAMATGDNPGHYAALAQAKKEGRIRYIGASLRSFDPEARIESTMRTLPVDFVGVDYAVDNRAAEEKILPLARERKIGVIAYFPFGGAAGASCASGRGLFSRVANTPLPPWASEFDAKTWAQFFLKYVVSHPAVTAVRVGTTKPHHMIDNIGGGVGRLPDEAMRRRMAEFMDSLPYEVPEVVLDRYAGGYATQSGTTLTFRREGATLFVKSGPGPATPLTARSARRFTDPQGTIFEFQVDPRDLGRFGSVIVEEGSPARRTVLTRIP